MNGSLQTGNEIETEVKIYGNDFCIENFFNPENGKLYMSGFVCINETEERSAPTQRGLYLLFLLQLFNVQKKPFNVITLGQAKSDNINLMIN